MSTSTQLERDSAAQLYELEKQFESLSKTTAVVQFDRDGIILDANDVFLNLMGYTREEVVGHHHRMFVRSNESESRDYIMFWQELGAGADQVGEFERVAKDGRSVWIEGSYNALVGEDGKVFKVVKYANDVTVRKTQENEVARITSMMENAPINIMCADRDGTIRYLNPKSVETLTTLQHVLPIPVKDIVGTSFDVFHKQPARQRKLIQDDSQLPINRQIEVGDEVLELLVSPMYGAGNAYLGPMVTWEVITDRLKQERELAEAQERERKAAAELSGKVDEMLAVVQAAADGDLTREVSVDGEDAIGQMGQGLKRLLSSLRESISGIAENASTLATASEELTATSQLMSANSEETGSQALVVSEASKNVADNVQTVASGTEELSASINEISASATRAAAVANEAVQVADNTNQTVSKLGESSSEIGQVVKVITSIAQQTNLLALNATIEAARAGEAGKGFAVVANEVKELAKETAKATEDISRKIEAIQGDTQESVVAIEKISEIIGQINDIQGTIASAVEEQTATTGEMARNVSNANSGTQEIVQNIGGVAQAAQETSRGASGVETAAVDLSKMANDLQQMVSRFQF